MLAQGLANLGIEVHVITDNCLSAIKSGEVFTPGFIPGGFDEKYSHLIQLHRTAAAVHWGVEVDLPFRAKIESVVRNFRIDIIQALCNPHLGNAALRAGQNTGTPVVCSLLTPRYELLAQEDGIGLTRYKRIVSQSKAVIALSNFTAMEFAPVLDDRKRQIQVIYPGVDIRAFPVRSKPLRGTRSRGGVVLFVGRIVLQKGLQYLLCALPKIRSAVPNLVLRIVGTGPVLNNMVYLAHRLGVEKNVEFLGPISQGRLLEAYHQANVFALPSRMEQAPISILEAMASELPVVANKVGGIPELVSSRSGLLLETEPLRSNSDFYVQEPGYVRELADAISGLLTDSRLSHELSRNARRRVCAKFDLRKMVNAHTRVYEGIIDH
jgi:glycosyltransferase involved in cell wall biosynthesis